MSPSARLPRARKTFGLIDDLRKRTEPSPKAKFEPPGWKLLNPPTNVVGTTDSSSGSIAPRPDRLLENPRPLGGNPVLRRVAFVPEAQPRSPLRPFSPRKIVCAEPSVISS